MLDLADATVAARSTHQRIVEREPAKAASKHLVRDAVAMPCLRRGLD